MSEEAPKKTCDEAVAPAPAAAAAAAGQGHQAVRPENVPTSPAPAAAAAGSGTSGGVQKAVQAQKDGQTSTGDGALGPVSMAASSTSGAGAAAASTPGDKGKATDTDTDDDVGYQPSPPSEEPNNSPCSLMRLTTNEADRVLYNSVRGILSDLGDDSNWAGAGAGGGEGRSASPDKTTPVSLALLRPSAALLTVVLLLLASEEIRSDGDHREDCDKEDGGAKKGEGEQDGGEESSPARLLSNFVSRHLSDLVAYCRTLDDAITIMDIVTFCLDFCKRGDSAEAGNDAVAAAARGRGSSGAATSSTENMAENIQRLRAALLKHEACKDIAVDGTFLKTLQEKLVTVLEGMSAQVRSDAEDSGDFTYLWDKCFKVHRRDFATAFLGTSGYESRYEALAEASRCAYGMNRYYRRSARMDNVGNVDALDGVSPAGLTVEQRIKGTVAKAACIALVYRCGNMEKEVREFDEKAHLEYEKRASEKEETKSYARDDGSNGVKPRKKNSRADRPIPSPSKRDSAAKDANKDIITENADSQKSKSYYVGSHRIPRTSQSVEAESLDALGAMVKTVDGDNASREEESPPDVIDTLVAATNELVAFLRSPSKMDTSKYDVTAGQIEEEMANIYVAFNADKKHFTALHSSLLDDDDGFQHGATDNARTVQSLAPFLCSHWARFDSGRTFTSLYFNKLVHANESPQASISGKIRAVFSSPSLIEYTNNHGSFVQSSYIRYEALRAVAPTIRAGLVASDNSILAQTPVAKVAILDLSTLDPFQGGTDLFAESIVKPMEENEWINSLLLDISRATAIKPSTRLRLYLRSGGRSEQGGENQWKDVMFLILNKVLGQVFIHYFDLSPSRSSESTAGSISKNKVGSNGELSLANIKTNMKVPEPITDDSFGAALLALYYFSLEAILFDESARLKTSKHPRLILNPGFHRALLSVCCVCLLRAIGVQSGAQVFDRDVSVAANGKTDILSVLELTRCSPYDYLKVSEIFLRSSEQAIFGGLPANIRRHINEIDEYLVQKLLWASSPVGSIKGKTLLNEVDNLLGSQIAGTGHTAKYWPVPSLMPTIEGEQDNMASMGELMSRVEAPPESSHLLNEYNYVDYLFRRISLLASKRISCLCMELSFPASVATQVWLAFRYILRSQTFLLQDRHMDHVILATTYAICKRLGLDPTNDLFSRVAIAYVAINQGIMSERACHQLFQRVKINTPEGYGNVIDFHNKAYVHPMQCYLLNSATLRATAFKIKSSPACIRTINDGNQRHTSHQVEGTNVFVGKRHRSVEPITGGESKKARVIYSFGDPGRRNIHVVQNLVSDKMNTSR